MPGSKVCGSYGKPGPEFAVDEEEEAEEDTPPAEDAPPIDDEAVTLDDAPWLEAPAEEDSKEALLGAADVPDNAMEDGGSVEEDGAIDEDNRRSRADEAIADLGAVL